MNWLRTNKRLRFEIDALLMQVNHWQRLADKFSEGYAEIINKYYATRDLNEKLTKELKKFKPKKRKKK